jgi:mannan endo-1,4-beta-mannosidase
MVIPILGEAGVRKKVVSLLFLLSLVAPNFLFQPQVTASAITVPVNSQATIEAKLVLQKLNTVSGVSTISGQHDYLESGQVNFLDFMAMNSVLFWLKTKVNWRNKGRR